MVDEVDAEDDVKEEAVRRVTTSRSLSGVVKTAARKATETTEASIAMAVSCREVIGGSRPQRHRVPMGRVRMVRS
jgi:hypothetical protein